MAAPESAPEPNTPPPVSDAAVPIARRIAASPVFFPLWLRGRPGPHARMPMVGWFDPKQLASTGMKSIVSLLIGEQSDKRMMQALASRKQEYYDHSVHYIDRSQGPQPDKAHPRDGMWIDHISDTGDGWNPTYAVAMAAAQRTLTVHGGTANCNCRVRTCSSSAGTRCTRRHPARNTSAAWWHPTPRPSAMTSPRRPHVYAIPGNHDWYDGLSAFSRLFCSDIGGRRFAGWWTRQKRSYFVLKLPHGWWLVGSDGQLQSDMDVPQIEHFREIASGT
jgi:hypothetical protein